jgi:hypothetical protein
MVTAMAYQCMNPRANVRRISISSVPGTSSPLPGCLGIDGLYLDGLYPHDGSFSHVLVRVLPFTQRLLPSHSGSLAGHKSYLGI